MDSVLFFSPESKQSIKCCGEENQTVLRLAVSRSFTADEKIVDAVSYRPGKHLLIGSVLKPRGFFRAADKTGLNQNTGHLSFNQNTHRPVSYTHLTLPTIYSV